MKLRVPILLSLLGYVASHFDSSPCGKEKQCIFVPSGCESQNNCTQMFSYNHTEDGWVDMEIYATNLRKSDNYIAVGFSEDKQMGGDAVTQCVFPAGGTPVAHLSYNNGKSNTPPLTPKDLLAEKENLQLVHGHRGEDGMYCLVRQKSTTGESKYAPALDQDFHIFLVRGPADDPRVIGMHEVSAASPFYPYVHNGRVNVVKRASPLENADVTNTTDTTDSTSLSRETMYWLKRLHGILMVFTWLVLVSSAILSARYLRDHFPGSTPWGLKWWFHIHRTLNLLALPFLLLAALFIFIAKEWSWQGPSVNKTATDNTSPGSMHSLLGTIAVLIAMVQPLMALLRCQPDTGARPIFNWTHRSLGIVALVLAVISILIASNSFLSVWADPVWSSGVVIFYIVIAVLGIVLFEILTYKKNKSTNKLTAMEMRNRSPHRYDDSGRVNHTPPKVINSRPLYGIAALYALFVLFSFCVAATLIVLLSI